MKKIEAIIRPEKLSEIICDIGKTGNMGDGKILILPVEEAIRVRTCERGKDAV